MDGAMSVYERPRATNTKQVPAWAMGTMAMLTVLLDTRIPAKHKGL